MKVKVQETAVESGGLQEQGEFRIKNSAKAFSILSSGLYSNKHQAILRELGCNAYDSHIEAGKSGVPFTVTLPTRLKPTLSVRDYGVGLDHDGVVQVYTTYFESTKQDSNDYVGCMGLGSKSPFSYTDSFSITAVKGGMRRLYTAYISERGIPSIALMLEEKTDEENGVEVSFAVNDPHDMGRFRDEAASIFRWFKTKPEIKGQEVEIKDIEYAYRDIVPGVHVRSGTAGNRYRPPRCSYALMGNVAYPIVLHRSRHDVLDNSLSEEEHDRRRRIYELYSEGGLVVEFGIGELDIAASREELSYDQDTIEALYRKGDEIISALSDYVAKQVDPLKTKWQRMESLRNLHNSNSSLFAAAVEEYMKKNPRKLPKYADTRRLGNGPEMFFAVEQVRGISEDLKMSYYHLEKHYARDTVTAHRARECQIRSKTETVEDVYGRRRPAMIPAYNITTDTVVVLQNDSGGLLPRIKAGVLNKQIPSKNVLAFRYPAKNGDREAVYKKLRSVLGQPPKVIMSSDLPKVASSTKKDDTLTAYYFRKGSKQAYGHRDIVMAPMKDAENNLTPTLEKVSNDSDGKGIYLYLPMTGHSITIGSRPYSPNYIYHLLRDVGIETLTGASLDTIYGLNKTMVQKVKNNKNWVNVFDFMIEKFEEIDWSKVRESVVARYAKQELRAAHGTGFDFEEAKGLLDLNEFKENPKSPFGRLIELNEKIEAGMSTHLDLPYKNLISFMQRIAPSDQKKEDYEKLRENIQIESVDSSVPKLLEEVSETYPMLKHLSLSGWKARENWKDAVDYIKLIDSTL